MKDRFLVFSVPIRRRLKGSILYTPSPRRNTINGVQECWVISAGAESISKHPMGTKCFVHDGFEFQSVKQEYLWDQLKEQEAFRSLREYVDQVEGEVAVELVPEGSILAIEEP
jgi:hypothetical protein